MYLKSLEMLGFKSFAEAKIQFPKGITAMSGPTEAARVMSSIRILWVLGEQSTKTLRSERMEDIIFNGTEVRKPFGHGRRSRWSSAASPICAWTRFRDAESAQRIPRTDDHPPALSKR